jgi:hypothetical protein
MSHELHYTSVPRGLKPGSRGFCTVGMTAQISGQLVDRLESLSGYQPVFPPHDPSAGLNPIVFSHLRLTIGGKVVSVLSRIGPAALDYSGRPNKYAHHVVLEGSECPEGGPAWLLSQPGFMQGAWEGEPREIPAGRTAPPGDRQPGMARAWQSLTGDGGWAGVLAESFLADSRRSVFVVFRPGMELLPLFVEVMALLPASRRWDVDFSTYFNHLPQNVTCAWRGVLEGSEEAKNARILPNSLVIDLCNSLGRANGGMLVHLARTGDRLAQAPHSTATAPGSARHIPRMPHDPAVPASAPSNQAAASRPPSTGGSYDLVPELARLMPTAGVGSAYENARLAGRGRRIPWVLISTICTVGLISLLSVAVFLVTTGNGTPRVEGGSDSGAGAGKQVDGAEPRTGLPKIGSETEAVHVNNGQKPNSNVPTKEKSEDVEPVPPRQTPAQNKEAGSSPSVANRVEPAPLPDQKRGPLVLFMRLPETPGQKSRLPDSKKLDHADAPKVESATLPPQQRYIQFSGILNMSTVFKKPARGKTLSIETESISSIGGKIAVATFTLGDGKPLEFRWEDGFGQSSQKDELASAVRDIVAKIKSKSGDEDYLLLRDPKPRNSKQPLDLRDDKSRKMDHFRKRHRDLIWADEKDALVGTKWKLGIRRWRIVNRLSKDGPEKVISAGPQGNRDVKEEVGDNISDGDVSLTIRISPEEREKIQVGLQFDSNRIKEYSEKRDRLFRDYRISAAKQIESLGQPLTKNAPKVQRRRLRFTRASNDLKRNFKKTYRS